jgi:hypothetical protein
MQCVQPFVRESAPARFHESVHETHFESLYQLTLHGEAIDGYQTTVDIPTAKWLKKSTARYSSTKK